MALILLVLLMSLVSVPALGQRVAVGVMAGLPVTEVADTAGEAFRYGGRTSFHLKRYLIGPSVQFGLPLGPRRPQRSISRPRV